MVKIFLFVSEMIIPAMIFFIIGYGLLVKKINVFEAFIEGAFSGVKTSYNIMPTFLGLMIAVNIIRVSGVLNMISMGLAPLTDRIGFPSEALPLTFMRLVSSSASTGLLLDIFKNYGPDSFIGRFVSIMMSCTETVFYTMSVYFMSIKITKTRYTLTGALIANFAGVLASVIITKYVFY